MTPDREKKFNLAFNLFLVTGMVVALVITTALKLQQPGVKTFMLLLAAFGVSLTRRKERPALMLLLYILYAATMLLGPVALLRYLWPVMLAAPLIAGSQSGTFSEGEADHSKHF